MSIHHAEKLLAACKFALDKLENITTEQFSQGGDKEIRDRLREAIKAAKGQK